MFLLPQYLHGRFQQPFHRFSVVGQFSLEVFYLKPVASLSRISPSSPALNRTIENF
jgi:hypothetical protein